jgi:hypothetical protein
MSYVHCEYALTFTCSPAWIEIREEIFEGQAPSDRHDLTARVFKQKLTKLMEVPYLRRNTMLDVFN